MKLSRSKCVFGVTELKFLGHIISERGIEPDPEKVSAIVDMPFPTNKKELQRFLGMVNYLGKFLPNLSDISAPLRNLLEKDVEWCFDAPQMKAVQELKEMVTNNPILKFYDIQLPTRVSSDASTEGLGAVMEQQHPDGWFPVAFALRSLSVSEQNCCQQERETLSIVFACECFNVHVYGTKFQVLNDHQPLSSIFNKSIVKAPPRIQKFLLRLQKYDFDMQYVPGKHLVVTDTLSRASLPDTDPEIPDLEMNIHVHKVISSLPISQQKLQQFKMETANDQTLQLVISYVLNGWPKLRHQVHLVAQPFYNVRHDLSCLHDLVLKGERIIVPSSMRKEMKDLLHTGHVGIERCKHRARESIYRPGLNEELKDLVSNCSTCLQHRNAQPKEPLIPHNIPTEVWSKVGTDLFSVKNKNYLIVADYNTKFFDVMYLSDTKAPTAVKHTKSCFAKCGIPKTVFSDNGPQFTSNEYKLFSKQ